MFCFLIISLFLLFLFSFSFVFSASVGVRKEGTLIIRHTTERIEIWDTTAAAKPPTLINKIEAAAFRLRTQGYVQTTSAKLDLKGLCVCVDVLLFLFSASFLFDVLDWLVRSFLYVLPSESKSSALSTFCYDLESRLLAVSNRCFVEVLPFDAARESL
jgi:hypothetical protein